MKIDIEKVQEKFITKYMDSENGINMCGISNIKIRQDYYDYVLQDGESLTDLCLSVGFEKKIPENTIPDVFMGVRVFCDVIGKIEFALKDSRSSD